MKETKSKKPFLAIMKSWLFATIVIRELLNNDRTTQLTKPLVI
jgi:hypothetical protein